jgi:peptide/nickel transport system ATP-binding protein
MNPLLQVDRLNVAFGAAKVVDDVSFAVPPGRIVALVGESGSGKTMVSRAVLGLLPHGAASSGRLLFEGRDLAALTQEELRRVRGARIGMVFQEPMTSLNPSMRIGAQMREALKLHLGLGEADCRARSIEMLARVRIADPESVLDCYPHQFSGGMRQRIMLASVMLPSPALLLADEPTTALDVLVQRDVLDVMVGLGRETGTGILLVTHDLALVAQYSSDMVVMRHGRVMETGATAEILAAPCTDYTRTLLASLPRRSNETSPSGPSSSAPSPLPPLLRIEKLVVNYYGARRSLFSPRKVTRPVRSVDLEIGRGELVAVVGESGSGKTTLARAVLRLVEPESGRITFDGQDMTALDRQGLRAVRARVGFVFQDPFSSLDPRLRVGDLIGEGLRNAHRVARSETVERVGRLLEEVGLTRAHAQRFPHQLSGGQRQRVAVARALIADPALLIADEPVSALDVTVQAELLRLLKRLQRERGFSCLFISHALGVVEQVADRVVVIHRGRIVEDGTRDDLFDDPRHPYSCALLGAAPRLEDAPGGGYRLAGYKAEPPLPPDGCAYVPWERPEPAADTAPLVELSRTHRVACVPDPSRLERSLR